jgi:PKD repeat protein
MQRLLYTMIFLFFLFPQLGIGQNYKWIRGGGSSTSLTTYPMRESVYSMCTDANGNVYGLSMMGNTSITADTFFKPSAYGSPQNLFLTSHTCGGQMRFAKLISGMQVYPYGITCDFSGHLYVAFFALHSSAALRIGYDTIISGDGNLCQAIAQFDTNGNFNWIRFIGPNLLSTLSGAYIENSFVAIDNMNNAHFVVSMRSGVQITSTITSNRGTYDLTYDAGGGLLSVHRLELDSTLFVKGITIDKLSNKLYAHGYRNNGAFPDSSAFPYIAAFNATRNRIWIDTFTNPYFPGNVAMGGIVADGTGNLYLTPNAPKCFVYRGDTAKNKLSVTSSKIASVMKIDTAGNLKWIKTYSGNTGINSLLDIAVTPTNKVATVGVMTNHVVCGTDTLRSYSGEGQNAYFTVLDTAGYIVTLQQLHGVGFYDLAYSCTSDNVGNLYIGGQVENNIWGGSLSPYTSVGGDTDYFIMKYGVDCSCTSMPVANYSYSGSFLSRSFTYTGTTVGVDSVRWTFGDGGTSTSLSPVHTYTGAGTYSTCVRVYTACGMDMHCSEISTTCVATPLSSFSDTGKLVHGFTYTGTTTGLDSVKWNFGDGNYGTGTATTHTYAVSDTYTVCATVYTNCGTHTWCKDIIATATVEAIDVPYSSDMIQAFPNPAKNIINILGINQFGEYFISNLLGKIIDIGKVVPGSNIIQISNLDDGHYVLEIRLRNGVKRVIRITRI